MDRIDGNEAQTQVGIKILVGGNVAAPALQAHFHFQLAAFAHRGDVDVLVENLDVAVGFNHAAGHNARLFRAQIQRLGAFACELERNLFLVEDDVGGVFNHSGD